IEVQNVKNQEANGTEVVMQIMKISPVAKKISNSVHLDIMALVGTGPGGRITEADVLKVLEVRVNVPEISERAESNAIPVTGMRKAIA
ncbi:E3 binding domain-containing protein, partial [Bacillus thuringiensis]|uniref:E3 binding domain-containing protein n=1 Tax=Bacillus thuringiensis TaxID=1428 RepID=UPI0028496CAD